MERVDNLQYGPFPAELAAVIAEVSYRPGWEFTLTGSEYERDHAGVHGSAAGGMTLIIFADVNDSHHPALRRPVNHLFEVPTATYNREAWTRWLFERCRDVETHEAMEWFRVGGEQPFAPVHAPGHDPYTVVQLTTDEARRTSFLGKVKGG